MGEKPHDPPSCHRCGRHPCIIFGELSCSGDGIASSIASGRNLLKKCRITIDLHHKNVNRHLPLTSKKCGLRPIWGFYCPTIVGIRLRLPAVATMPASSRGGGRMQLNHYVHMLGDDLKQRYGERIHKLSLHGAFTCPNRDGTLGRGGCTFCNVASFADEQAQVLPIQQQLRQRASESNRASRYLAYFQAYTSTYAEVDYLRQMYEEALGVADIVGLCVGTRPDCVPDAVLDLLSGYRQRGFEIWLELGLQSANEATLKRINRGHGYRAYEDAVIRARARGIKVCTHLIVGLPGEPAMESLTTLQRVVQTGTDGIKLHPLHVVDGSTLGKAWQAGRLQVPTLAEYVQAATAMIQHTPPEVVYHRVSASARRPTLLAPEWCENRWSAMVEIAKALSLSGGQGSALDAPYVGP